MYAKNMSIQLSTLYQTDIYPSFLYMYKWLYSHIVSIVLLLVKSINPLFYTRLPISGNLL